MTSALEALILQSKNLHKVTQRQYPVPTSTGEEVDVVLDQTAFYAESGGQVGDRGLLTSVSDASEGGAGGPLAAVAAVHDVQRAAGGSLFVHSVAVQRGRMHVGQQVPCRQDHLRNGHRQTKCWQWDMWRPPP
jgi:alanyl-tRNA synthetase